MRSASVSVVIPTYNRAKYLTESIDSVLAQTLQPRELIIIDDESTDDTKDLVLAYKAPNIRYLTIPHGGIAAARNKGMALASCDYLAFLDSDDRWRNTMIERQLEMLTNDQGLVCSFTNFARFQDEPYQTFPAQFEFYSELSELKDKSRHCNGGYVVEGDAFTAFTRFHEFPAATPCIMFRRSIISDMQMNESLRIGEDTEFILRAFMRGKVAFLPDVLADIRWHASNITRQPGTLIELDKIRALLCLQEVVDTEARKAALNDRLVKGYLDYAGALIRSGKRIDGIASYWNALKIPGSPKRKIKGLARTTLNVLTSLRSRHAARPD